MNIRYQTIALGLAGVLALGTTAFAGPIPTGTAAVKQAASGNVSEIRWRGHGIGPGLAFGLAAGALAGAAVASRPYGPDYYYGGPVYGDPYVYDAPVYAPGYSGYGYGYGYGGYGWGQCYTNDGYGRRRPCDGY